VPRLTMHATVSLPRHMSPLRGVQVNIGITLTFTKLMTLNIYKVAFLVFLWTSLTPCQKIFQLKFADLNEVCMYAMYEFVFRWTVFGKENDKFSFDLYMSVMTGDVQYVDWAYICFSRHHPLSSTHKKCIQIFNRKT